MNRTEPTSTHWLAMFVVAYSVTHHSGLFYGTGAAVEGSRVADWLDMLTPLVVLGPLLVCLAHLRPAPKWWAVFAVGAVLYAQGKGIHIAANSVSNVIASDDAATDVVHLWDEIVGHYVWYSGTALAVVAVVGALHGSKLTANRWLLIGGGALWGLTWATNGLEGGTAVFSLVLAGSAMVYGFVHRAGLALSVGAAGIVATAIIGVYGVVHTGFPQPSSI